MHTNQSLNFPDFFKMKVLVFLIAVGILSAHVEGGKVLFLYPNASPSHKNIANPIISGLSERGHNVTVVSWMKSEGKNVRDIIPRVHFDYMPRVTSFEFRRKGYWGVFAFDYEPIFEYCDQVYQHQPFLDLLNEKFDVVLIDYFAHECFLGLVHRLGAPLIMISPLPVQNYVSVHVGNRLPTSFVPYFHVTSGDKMSFLERAFNTIGSAVMFTGIRYPFTTHAEIYRKYLGQDVPSVDVILGNMSLVLSNAHFSFNFPRPTLPDVVEIGAIHCRPGKPLPMDLQEFLDGAKDGFILFSLGSVVRPEDMPEETRKAFLSVFSKLKLRVLWKWPLQMSDAPPNVKLLKWVPQQDVLAHPNIALFITHGGLLSTHEGIYHGVPMVHIPFFYDQDQNAKRAKDAGCGLTVEILGMKEEDLDNAVNEVLRNPKYRKNVKEMSIVLRDQPETPQERGVFWVEYVMRHKGARHLRSAARDLNFFQYHSLDVVAVLLLLVLAVIFVCAMTIRKIFQLIFCRSKQQKKVKKQ